MYETETVKNISTDSYVLGLINAAKVVHNKGNTHLAYLAVKISLDEKHYQNAVDIASANFEECPIFYDWVIRVFGDGKKKHSRELVKKV